MKKKWGEPNILYTRDTRQYAEQIGRKNTVRSLTGTRKNFSITAVTWRRRLGSRRPTLTACTFISSTPPHPPFAGAVLLYYYYCYGVPRQLSHFKGFRRITLLNPFYLETPLTLYTIAARQPKKAKSQLFFQNNIWVKKTNLMKNNNNARM